MPLFPPTVVLRHRKENVKKCSLRSLEDRSDFAFFPYPVATLPCLQQYLLLDLDAPALSAEDNHLGLLVIDATWRYAADMRKLPALQPLVCRSIPSGFRTAYPRKQTGCSDPDRGLASIEAIYVAYFLLGRDTSGLLDHYYWAEQFLEINSALFQAM